MDQKKLKSMLIASDATIKQGMQQLISTGERILFVVDGSGVLIGTVTDGDIRRALVGEAEYHSTPLSSIMCREFLWVASDAPDGAEKSRCLMVEKKIDHIPVLDADRKIVTVHCWFDVIGTESQHEAPARHDNQVVIMAGGKGTRMAPFTSVLPKPLIPIGEKPLIEIIMNHFAKQGFTNFIYSLNYKKEYIKLYLKECGLPYTIDWIEEDEFLGTAGSLYYLKDKTSDTFILSNCDSVLHVDFGEVLDWHREHGAALTVLGCHSEYRVPFGILETSEGKLVRIREKPVHDMIVNTGVYVVEPSVFRHVSQPQHMDMDKLLKLVMEKDKVSVYPLYSGWLDFGQWEEYRKSATAFERSALG